ncbi:MAG: DUF3090 family protein [Chloroflexi bacterium]|nr:DUF3090 family protein [Chloroflexota bacterium]
MPDDINLPSVDFITVGTIGSPGNRVFHLQARQNEQLVTFLIEKEQASALAEGIQELFKEIEEQYDRPAPEIQVDEGEMELQEPILPVFRIAQMQIGYDPLADQIQLLLSELTVEEDAESARTARLGVTREQMHRVGVHAAAVVSRGRARPEQNGYRMHY